MYQQQEISRFRVGCSSLCYVKLLENKAANSPVSSQPSFVETATKDGEENMEGYQDEVKNESFIPAGVKIAKITRCRINSVVKPAS